MIAVQGCATAIPEMVTLGQPEFIQEVELIQLIKCELHYGAQLALEAFPGPGKGGVGGYGVEWLKDWEAKVSLKVTVDEQQGLSPGVTYKEPLSNALTFFGGTVAQNFSLSGGLSVSSKATKVETIGFSYTFADLLSDGRISDGECKHAIQNKIVVNDLKIGEFILNKAYVANHTDAVVQNGTDAPYSAFSYESTFIVTYGGNITPVWNLIHITANSNSPLYLATRSKSHNLSITLGKVGSSYAAAVANANLIGQAVARALGE
jgi:hypothetical protein